jgi:hypothetical protein
MNIKKEVAATVKSIDIIDIGCDEKISAQKPLIDH